MNPTETEARPLPRHDLNLLIYRVLWGGIILSVTLILIGLGLGSLNPAGLPQAPLKLLDLGTALGQLTPAGFLALGVIVMILTPVARVVLSVLIYVEERDRAYVVITLVVFLNLLFGIVLGFA
jgi:uncharacterized membrane protein